MCTRGQLEFVNAILETAGNVISYVTPNYSRLFKRKTATDETMLVHLSYSQSMRHLCSENTTHSILTSTNIWLLQNCREEYTESY